MDVEFAVRQSDSAPTCENPTVILPLLASDPVWAAFLEPHAVIANTIQDTNNAEHHIFFILISFSSSVFIEFVCHLQLLL